MKLKKLTIFASSITLLVVAIFILASYFNIQKDDYVVRQYLLENVEENRGGIWLVGSSWTIFGPAREYIFTVGAEGTLEVVVSYGKVVSSRWLNKIPHMWSGSDSRVNLNEKWR